MTFHNFLLVWFICDVVIIALRLGVRFWNYLDQLRENSVSRQRS